MKIKLYNTLAREVQELIPLNNNEILFYSCGLTVYSQPHIGNWVGYIYWDVLVRVLEENGFQVKHVQNITDVGHLVSDDDNGEDKMEKGARKEGLSAWEVADKYIDIADHEAYDLLGLKKPQLVRATACINDQIDFVKKLEDLGFTYVIEGEGVYFDTSKLDDYGKLARLDIDGLQAGSRVEFNGKKNITDFALWKFSPEGQKRDMEWESPWGTGFPGWHLECSVIVYKHLGAQIDIHSGGIDHIPIHHTNEIAQTESVTGKQMSSFWLHNNHLKVDGGKMAKSVGNIYSLQDIIDKGFSLDAFKLLVLSKSFQTEGNFTWEIMESAQSRLNRWKTFGSLVWQLPQNDKDVAEEINNALLDNLNTPEAIKIIDVYFDEIEKSQSSPNTSTLDYIDRVLGVNLKTDDISSEQKQLLSQRDTARTEKNWQLSDELRQKLNDSGLEVKDEPSGQIWSKK